MRGGEHVRKSSRWAAWLAAALSAGAGVACGGSTVTKRSPETAPTPSSPSSSAPASIDTPAAPVYAADHDLVITAAERAALAKVSTEYVRPGETVFLEDLVISLEGVEVKQDTDGREVLRVVLRLRAGDEEGEMYASGDGTPAVFAGHLVEVRGGSKEAVGVAVLRR
jgi:hypothetical protein